MSENINGTDLLGSGGHVWIWSPAQVVRKTVGTAGIIGVYGAVISIGAAPCLVAGKGGSAALLKATGAGKAASDTALNAIETAIEYLVKAGGEYPWEDDQSHTGTALQLLSFVRVRERLYNAGNTAVWQYYRLVAQELNGG